MAPPETDIETKPIASHNPKAMSSSPCGTPLLLATSTAMLKTSIVATTGGSAMKTLARSSCHIVSGAMRSSWKQRRSLGTEGDASAEDMNIDRKVTSATFDQKPLRLRDGWLRAAA